MVPVPDFRIALGEWLPDLADSGHDGLTVCRNVYPVANGYSPVGALEAVTAPLSGWTGGGAFTHSDGSTVLLGGKSDGLYSFGTSWGSELAVSAGRWRFAKYRNLVVGVHGGAPVAYDLATGTAGALGGTPPDASLACVANEFVVLAGDPAELQTVTWSGFGNPEEWTAGTNQSDSFPLPDGGKITGLAGGEYLLVFQGEAIHRFQYVGGDDVWQRQKISSDIGCIEPGSICQAGRMVFFLSNRGFMMCDGETVTPIGTEKVDRTFFNTYERASLSALYAAVNPRHYLACWSMPGNPGTVWQYNWVLQRWSTLEIGLTGIVGAYTSSLTVDGVDAAYPGGMDAIDLAVDSAVFSGGDPRFYVVDQSGALGTLTGANLAACFDTALVQLVPGQFVRPHGAFVETDATEGFSLRLDGRARLGDAENVATWSSVRSTGHLRGRQRGRFMRIGLDLTAGADWSFAQAINIEAGTGGTR